ncbi:phosphoglycolate phosphatase [Iodidimonas nitroreducens]|uniref:Phosphoglycolate phosphatase n=1 Tax=Iodidimonas nitroreducens TaxID=1236968 RepID=A0A5A7N951_9PROT|nr:HAD-IA family hydrolase [Iodidimonas nitroreducens]GER04873.1 phosphoglycolate phosphatase [Iodidimonas nitroreducens]
MSTVFMPKTSFQVDKIIFDLDGTLVDSAPDLCAAMNHVLATLDRPSLPLADVRSMVGLGARALIGQGLKATGGIPDGFMIDQPLDLFIRHYRANIARHSQPYAGAHDVLRLLKERGFALGLCTNKPQDLALSLLDALSMRSYFTSITGGDALPFAKPHPMHLDHVRQSLPGRGAAVMIGDSITDAKAARASQMDVILVSFGYSPEPVESLGADLIISDLRALPGLIVKENHR